ncbi:MAG: PspC domain-containing protein [Saprospiraceae bacterium]|nr:PspC domain-containing protein [Saprospiraceae bacterium]
MMLESIRNLVEKSAFGVCSYLGDRFGIRTANIRLYFIYTSFVAMGSPVILYLFLAFWLNIRNSLRAKYNLVLE